MKRYFRNALFLSALYFLGTLLSVLTDTNVFICDILVLVGFLVLRELERIN